MINYEALRGVICVLLAYFLWRIYAKAVTEHFQDDLLIERDKLFAKVYKSNPKDVLSEGFIQVDKDLKSNIDVIAEIKPGMLFPACRLIYPIINELMDELKKEQRKCFRTISDSEMRREAEKTIARSQKIVRRFLFARYPLLYPIAVISVCVYIIVVETNISRLHLKPKVAALAVYGNILQSNGILNLSLA